MVAGVNILTLFNDRGKPIAERLLFNPDGIKVNTLPKAQIFKERDSIYHYYTA